MSNSCEGIKKYSETKRIWNVHKLSKSFYIAPDRLFQIIILPQMPTRPDA
jgi:hypothetical protein